MQETLLLTVIGPDRPGIVDELAHHVADAGGNWLESRLSHLAGVFAGVVQVSVPTGQQEAFTAGLVALREKGLDVAVREGVEKKAPVGSCVQLEIVGQDRPGIVRALSEMIVAAGGNVETFASAVKSAPMSGEMLFEAQVKVCFEHDQALTVLEERLCGIGEELMLDVNLGTSV